MKRLIIERITVEDLKEIISEAIEQSFKKQKDQDEFLTIEEASQLLKIPVTTIYDYTSNKKIPFHKKGKKLHFSRQELSLWMKTKNGEQ